MNLSIVYELLTKNNVGVKVAKIGEKTKNNGGPRPALYKLIKLHSINLYTWVRSAVAALFGLLLQQSLDAYT
jgi:hypothetical protein